MEGLAEADAHVLDRVVVIHLQVAGGRHLQVEKAVTGHHAQHVVEKRYTGPHGVGAAAVKVQGHLNVGLGSAAVDGTLTVHENDSL